MIVDKRARDMKWEILNALEYFPKYEDEWQKINDIYNRSNPVLDKSFIWPLIKYFSTGTYVYLAIENTNGEIQSLILVQYDKYGQWRLFMPSQAALGPMALRKRTNVQLIKSIGNLCRSLPGYVFQVGFQKQDPDFSQLTDIEDEKNVHSAGHAPTTYICVDSEFQLYWEQRSKSVRQSINRTIRTLKNKEISFELLGISDQVEIANAVDQYADIESSGWKGRNGTAIARTNVQGSFYRDVMTAFAKRRSAYVYQLKFADKIVASLLTIVGGNIQVVLKTTYLEEYAKYGPGRFLDYLMIKKVFGDDRISRVENYTNASQEDIKWASGTRDIYHVNYLRNNMYRLIYDFSRFISAKIKK